MTPTPKPKSLNEWLQGWLAPSVLVGLFVLLVGWGIRVEVHLAKDTIHVPRTTLDACYVKSDVDQERAKRIDEKLAEIKDGMADIRGMVREMSKR